MTNQIEDLPFEILDKIISFINPKCICYINCLHNLSVSNKFFHNYLKNIILKIKKSRKTFLFKYFDHYNLDNKYHVCRIHEKKRVEYFHCLKNNNIEKTLLFFKDKKPTNVDLPDYKYLFNTRLEDIRDNFDFFHFSSIEESIRFRPMFKYHFKDVFQILDVCCSGKGIKIALKN